MTTTQPTNESKTMTIETTIKSALRNGTQTDDHVCCQIELSGWSVEDGDLVIEAMVERGELVESFKQYPEFGRVGFLTLAK